MLRVESPGIYRNVPAVDYHADCCPEPSLSRSIAQTLLTQSPWHAWHCHPRLSPTALQENTRRLDLGTIAHALLIGQGRSCEEIHFNDYRSNAAKERRDLARADGKTPVLSCDLAAATLMVEVARRQLAAIRGCEALFDPTAGEGEVVIAWQEDEETWCRAMLDWLPTDRRVWADYKTTIGSANPLGLGRRVADQGYELQAAFYEAALTAIEPDCAGRISPVFIFQEIEPPFAISAITLDEEAMTVGRKKFERALAIWRECLATNTWPAYPRTVTPVIYPSWAAAQWLDREALDYLREQQGDYDPLSMGRPGAIGGGRLE